MAARAGSTPDSRPLSSELAIALLSADAAKRHQLVDELIFRLFDLFVTEVAGLARQLELLERGEDRRLVELIHLLSLLLNDLRQPDRPAYGGQWKREQAGDQAHVRSSAPSSESAKLNGGTGPTKRMSIRSPSSSLTRATPAPNASMPSRATRNAMLKAS